MMNKVIKSVSGEDVVIATARTTEIDASKIEKVSPLDFVSDGQYVVIAGCPCRQVLVCKDGKFGFDDLDYAVAIRDEHCFDGIEVSVCLVQKGMDEYGVVANELIKCVG